MSAPAPTRHLKRITGPADQLGTDSALQRQVSQAGVHRFTACGLSELNELSKNVNYSELARRLNIADGTTVKMHLSRYIGASANLPLLRPSRCRPRRWSGER